MIHFFKELSLNMKITSYYVANITKKNEFQELLLNNKFLAVQLEDYKHGYAFYYQLVFNLYTFLTTDSEKLLMDDTIRLDYPFQSYIHELMIKQTELLKVKQIKSNNHLICLLIAINIKNNLKSDLHKISNDMGLQSELPLEIINFYVNTLNDTPEEHTVNQIHRQFLNRLKEQVLVSTYFNKIIKDSIDYSKRYYNLLLKEF